MNIQFCGLIFNKLLPFINEIIKSNVIGLT